MIQWSSISLTLRILQGRWVGRLLWLSPGVHDGEISANEAISRSIKGSALGVGYDSVFRSASGYRIDRARRLGVEIFNWRT